MNQALGLLETKGLIGAIEAADAMAKAADVTIVSKEKSTAALVTIKIAGDTSAVRAALDAGAVAAESIGQLISVHLIPSPDNQIKYLISNTEKVAVKPKTDNFEEKIVEPVSEIVNTAEEIEEYGEKETIDIAVEKPESKINSEEGDAEDTGEPEHINLEEKEIKAEEKNIFENFAEKKDSEPKPEISSKTLIDIPIEEKEPLPEEENLFGMGDKEENVIVDGANIPSMEELENLSVPELRKLARNVANFPIKGREISKANKQILLSYFKML